MKKNVVNSELKNKILFLELNNPQNQNTLSEELIEDLNEKFKLASKNENVKVIILSSTGPVFCAGHNLKDLNSRKSDSDNGKSYYRKIEIETGSYI